MIRLQGLGIGAACLGPVLLAGCGMDPVQPDQDVTLQPNYGIVVVVVDTLDPLNGIYFKQLDNRDAPDIEISHTDKGVYLMPFVVPAGTYCATRFSFSNYRFTQNNPRDVCFDVIAGKVAYSGNIGPRAEGGRAYLWQNYDWAAFEKMFKQQYPKLATYAIVTP